MLAVDHAAFWRSMKRVVVIEQMTKEYLLRGCFHENRCVYS